MGKIRLAKDATSTHEPARVLLGTTRDRIVSINLDAITTIEAVGGVAVVHTAEERFILRETLATLEQALPRRTFVRMNHAVIMNISQVDELQVLGGGGGNHFQMKDGRVIALTPQLSELESLLRHALN